MSEMNDSIFELLRNDPVFSQWLGLISEPVMILDNEMKLITANHDLLRLINATDSTSLVGRRPLEVVNCQFMNQSNNISQILSSLRQLHADEEFSEECSLVTHDGQWLNFRIRLKNFNYQDIPLIIMFMHDIADEKYRNALERIFFNDLTITASGLYSLLSIVANAPETGKELLPRLLNLAQGLLDDIESQRDLRLAEQDEIIPQHESVNVNDLIHELTDYLKQLEPNSNKNLKIINLNEQLTMLTDRRLLRRVLNNMLKNAFEASQDGDTVSVEVSHSNNRIRFSIHNPGVIAPETAERLFERFYSTKGKGRGWGTYSMKLLTERYLGGEISFETSAETGTTFHAEYPESI